MKNVELTNADKWKASFRSALRATLLFFAILSILGVITNFQTLNPLYAIVVLVKLGFLSIFLPFFVAILFQERLLHAMGGLFIHIVYLIGALFLMSLAFWYLFGRTDPIGFYLVEVFLLPSQFLALLVVLIRYKRRSKS